MKLSWSHAVMYVDDVDSMLDFYTNTMGFGVTDRGQLGKNEIIFMSQNPDEHHQLAFVTRRKNLEPSNSVNHFAFRVDSLEEVINLHGTISNDERVKGITPMSHGNTLSVYFRDPEGNGIEVFWDTPWHVAQPQGETWDVTLSKDELLEWVSETFKEEPGFGPRRSARRRWRGRGPYRPGPAAGSAW